MSLTAALLLVLLAATLAAFIFELLPVDVTALCLLTALVGSGIVPVEQAFSGFSNKAVLTIAGLFALSHALVKTGLLEVVGDRLSRRFAIRHWMGIAVLLGLVAVLSGFLNNTAVVAMTIPLAMDLCRRFELSPSKVLIPLSYATIFGGTLTLIGTSTNLLVNTLVEQAGERPLGMFELTPVGLVFLVCGLFYVLLLAPRMLPDRAAVSSLTREFRMSPYLTEVQVRPDSGLVGRSVRDLALNERYDVTVLTVIRGARRIAEDLRGLALEAGDVLVSRGAVDNLLRLRHELGAVLLTGVELTDEEVSGEGQVVVEALVGPGSGLVGKTLQEVDFRRAYGSFVLALRRDEATLRERLAHTPLQFADTLLLVTSRRRLADLQRNEDLILTSELDLRLHREPFWWLPVVLIPMLMVLAATEVLDLLVGVLAAVTLLLVCGVLRPRDTYRAVDWHVVVFLAAFIPVGDAMLRTGLAEILATAVLLPAGWLPEALVPWVAVSLLYLVTSLLTETLTNNATAVVLTPVALQMSAELGVDPRSFIFAICFAASASFMTPTGYQTNMMVYGPGHYRFTDYVRFGAPLNLLFWLVASFLIPWVFPFH